MRRPDRRCFANLRDAKKAGCRFVDFTGGEPLLHPELPRFLSEPRPWALSRNDHELHSV